MQNTDGNVTEIESKHLTSNTIESSMTMVSVFACDLVLPGYYDTQLHSSLDEASKKCDEYEIKLAFLR